MNQLLIAYEAMSQNGIAVNITTSSSELFEFGRFLIDTVTEETRNRVKQGKDDVLLSIEDVMNRLQIKDRTTLWRWEKRGYLLPVRSGKKCLYKNSDIENLLTQKQN